MIESQTSTPRKHVCPLCQQPYSPTAATRNFLPREEAVTDREESQLRSITYHGVCPNGHTVEETVEA